MKTRNICGIALALICALSTTLQAQYIYVENPVAGTIGEYSIDGTGTTSLISGLAAVGMSGLAISGTNMFVVLRSSNVVAEYSTSGALLNPSFITLPDPECITVSGTNIFVGYFDFGGTGPNIAEYTTSGQIVNKLLLSDFSGNNPQDVAVSGTNLFVAYYNPGFGTQIGEYTTSGQTINATLLSFPPAPITGNMAISGTNLYFVTEIGVSLYSTSGTQLNEQLIYTGIVGQYAYTPNTAGVALLGTNLFVSDANLGTIAEYTQNGTPVKDPVVSGVLEPYHFAFGAGPPPPTPQLSIATVGNQSVVFYPSWAAGYQLQGVTNVSSTNWVTLSNSAPIIGATVTNNLPANFFRLAPALGQ
jgi:hypothetical protein